VSEKEKKLQEAINEVIYTEKDFVRDLEYIRDVGFMLRVEILGKLYHTNRLEYV